jgi:hypothetical protein
MNCPKDTRYEVGTSREQVTRINCVTKTVLNHCGHLADMPYCDGAADCGPNFCCVSERVPIRWRIKIPQGTERHDPARV